MKMMLFHVTFLHIRMDRVITSAQEIGLYSIVQSLAPRPRTSALQSSA